MTSLADFHPASQERDDRFSGVREMRRRLVRAAVALPLAGPMLAAGQGRRDSAYVSTLQRGHCVVLIRHAQTVSGIGDPPGMRLDDCSSQRDLSEEGRAQSRRLGQWFGQHGLTPSRVRSSQWCRCLNTAKEAFSEKNFGTMLPVEPWTALNSFFQGQGNREAQLAEATEAARLITGRKSDGQFEVWVTHQVTVSALTGHWPSMGEMLVAAYDSPGRPFKILASGLAF